MLVREHSSHCSRTVSVLSASTVSLFWLVCRRACPGNIAAPYVQGWSYLLGQPFSSCLVLKFARQRGEGQKRGGIQISKQSTQNRWPKKYYQPCIVLQRGEGEKKEGVQISKQSMFDPRNTLSPVRLGGEHRTKYFVRMLHPTGGTGYLLTEHWLRMQQCGYFDPNLMSRRYLRHTTHIISVPLHPHMVPPHKKCREDKTSNEELWRILNGATLAVPNCLSSGRKIIFPRTVIRWQYAGLFEKVSLHELAN